MNINFEVHGVLSIGHTIWNKKSDYAKKFYTSDEIRGGGSSAFFIEIIRDLAGYKTYYTYIINNVCASSNRSGSYFGVTISTDALYTDIKLIYAALDSIFNKMVLGKILTKLSTGGFKYICDRDFSEAENELQKMKQTFHRVIEVVSTPSDILNIPATFNKANKRLTIDAANLSNDIIDQLLKGLTVVAIPNMDAERTRDLEKELTHAKSQLSNCSQQLAAANDKYSAMERHCKDLELKVTTLDVKVKNVPPVQVSIKDLEKLVEDAKTIIFDFNKFVNSKIPKGSQPMQPVPDRKASIFRKFLPIIVIVLLSIICFLAAFCAFVSAKGTTTPDTPTDTITYCGSDINETEQTVSLQLALDSIWKIDIPGLTLKTIRPNKDFSFELVNVEYDGRDPHTRIVHPDSSIRWAIVENNKVRYIENNSFKAPDKGYLIIMSILNNKIIAMRAIGIGIGNLLGAFIEWCEPYPYPYYIAQYSNPGYVAHYSIYDDHHEYENIR